MKQVRLAVASIAVCLTLASIPSVAGAEGTTSQATTSVQPARQVGVGTACEEMTDSILRLYFAYFGRFPDQGGFDHWVSEYKGEWGLTRISEFFAISPEFVATYGSVNNEQFVELIYNNVLGRGPDAGGRAFWLNELNRGVRRGTVMLSFSESLEYVQGTGTFPPLAGFLRWYPADVRWDCLSGSLTFPVGDVGFIDTASWNSSATASAQVKIEALDANMNLIGEIANVTIGTERIYTTWNNGLAGTGTVFVRFTAPPLVVQTIVVYDSPMPADRPRDIP